MSCYKTLTRLVYVDRRVYVSAPISTFRTVTTNSSSLLSVSTVDSPPAPARAATPTAAAWAAHSGALTRDQTFTSSPDASTSSTAAVERERC